MPDVPTGSTEYFTHGKTRIKITEHFPEGGKQISELLELYIMEKAAENTRKTA